MGLFKKKPPSPEQMAAEEAKSFFDCVCPATMELYSEMLEQAQSEMKLEM